MALGTRPTVLQLYGTELLQGMRGEEKCAQGRGMKEGVQAPAHPSRHC